MAAQVTNASVKHPFSNHIIIFGGKLFYKDDIK